LLVFIYVFSCFLAEDGDEEESEGEEEEVKTKSSLYFM